MPHPSPPADDASAATKATEPMPLAAETLVTAPSPLLALSPGKHLGKFRIESRLGEGGMGVVYKAMDERLERIVALKVLKPELARDRQFAERFLREARSAARLNHPHVVTIFEADHTAGTLYLAFEYVTGGDLSQRIKTRGPLPCADALRILIECAEGLQALHKAGLVHRDIKPQNIFLDAEGHAKLGDLGLARTAGTKADLHTSLGGTPAYMSPEQVEGLADIDIRSDIHALGGTLYAMLTGKAPFDGATPFAITHRVLAHERPHPRQARADLPEQVDALVLKAMAFRRDDRHATPVELVMDLRRVAGGQGLEVGPPPPSVPAAGAVVAAPPPPGAAAGQRWLLPVVVTAAIIISVAIAYGVMQHRAAQADDLRQEHARLMLAQEARSAQERREADAMKAAEVPVPALAAAPAPTPVPALAAAGSERRAPDAGAEAERSAEALRRSAAAQLEAERQAVAAQSQGDAVRLREALKALDRAEPIPPGAQEGLSRLATATGKGDDPVVRWQRKIDEVQQLKTACASLDQGGEASDARRADLDRLRALVGPSDADVERWSRLFGPLVPWATAKGRDAQGFWAELTVQGVVQRFRYCPPGSFAMGSPADEAGRGGDERQHQVTLTRGFWIADSECSQALWQALMGRNPSRFNSDPQQPVEQVSWDDCQMFLQQLNRVAPNGTFSLPTEAQWEYACRAGTTTPFSWGGTIATDQVNYDGSLPYGSANKGENRRRTVAVKTLPANAWGLHEMHGNVWEWCQDGYGAYPQGAVTDPLAASGTQRVARGGSWFGSAQDGRSAARGWFAPATRDGGLGLRVAAR